MRLQLERDRLDHVVGIGSSAGGLEALKELAGSLVPSGRISYVVAQHLAPEHRSRIVDLMAHATDLRVVTATDGAQLKASEIAIAPPNHDLILEGDRLRLLEPTPRFGPSPCIDLLFESIADQWGDRGVAVVLSGTGADGARGVRAVRAAGGLTLAQAPEDAKFDAMPRAAIQLGGADLVLDGKAIGERLAELSAAGEHWIERPLLDSEPLRLSAVTAPLKLATGIDFSQYKETTLRRQVQRRMAIRQVSLLADYLPLLTAESEEAKALLKNLLVSVTSFFRDPHAFEALGEALATVLDQRESAERLRVWVPGCATGEEVYTIAMVISGLLGHPADLASRVKLFGTDLDEQSLAIARRAVYPISAAKSIPDELRQRFVIERDGQMEIREGLRSCAVFARHDVGDDPPFPSLDLISCRNTLIYFTAPMQDRVLDRFRFGLVPGGLLLLGSSEYLGSRDAGFEVADAEHRLYLRTQEGARRPRQPLPQPSYRASVPFTPIGRFSVLRETVPEQHIALLEALTRTLCRPSLVLDEHHDLVEVIGDVSPYCRVPEGRMTAVANAFLRPELQPEARALFLRVRADGVAISSQTLRLDELDLTLHLEARPLPVGERTLTLLTFVAQTEEMDNPAAVAPVAVRDRAFDEEIERLERELLGSQEILRRSLDELEQANEELEASTEELQASSEELQSSNEELEASNEELQATNEELGTLNQQLRARSDELEQLNVELENIQTSLSQGMVIVDQRLCVTRFSPLAVRVFGLVASDIGQSLLGVPTTVPLPGLRQALQDVVDGRPRHSIEASSEEVSYLVQVLPYLERDGRRRGAIITLTDVSELVGLRQAAESALTEFASLTDALDEAVWKFDPAQNQLLYVSKRIQALTGWTPAEVCDRPGLLDGAIDQEDRARVRAARDVGSDSWSVRYRLTTQDGRRIWVSESARVMKEGNGRFVVGTLADLTEVQSREDRDHDRSAVFETVFRAASFGVAVLDAKRLVTVANEAFGRIVGVEPKALAGVSVATLCPPEEMEGLIEAAPVSGRSLQLRSLDGSFRPVLAELRGLPGGAAELVLIVIPSDPDPLQELRPSV